MKENAAHDALVANLIKSEDDAMLRMAQRLAAADAEIRLALSHSWWTGLRQGLEAASDSPLKLPRDPFSSVELAVFRGDESPF
jgi:hypothetical protein